MADLGDAAIGVVGAVAALGGVWLEGRRRDARAREEQALQLRTGARLLAADLRHASAVLRDAKAQGRWDPGYETETSAWDVHAGTIVNEVNGAEFADLMHAFRQIRALERAVEAAERGWGNQFDLGHPDGFRERIEQTLTSISAADVVLDRWT